MKTTIYTHDSALTHDTGAHHPEQMARMATLMSLFDSLPFDKFSRSSAPCAPMEYLLYAHRMDYIQAIKDAIPPTGIFDLNGEVVLSPGTWHAALHAAGGVCRAVDDVVSGKTRRAFCAMRPPGHHALADKAMGFCLFNNVFIAARHAQIKYGLHKIAIVDFDVHHGNGTDAMTRAHDGSVLFISTHQYPLWPMSGLPEDNEPCVQNWTFPPGTDSALFRKTYDERVIPALNAFKPELILISAGFDAHRDDPIGGMNLTEDDYDWVTRALCTVANESAGGKVISVLEGGYDLNALKSCTAAHLNALAAA